MLISIGSSIINNFFIEDTYFQEKFLIFLNSSENNFNNCLIRNLNTNEIVFLFDNSDVFLSFLCVFNSSASNNFLKISYLLLESFIMVSYSKKRILLKNIKFEETKSEYSIYLTNSLQFQCFSCYFFCLSSFENTEIFTGIYLKDSLQKIFYDLVMVNTKEMKRFGIIIDNYDLKQNSNSYV